MKTGIMQPYFFPYLGYWQLMNAVDLYVVYDDVNYINRGWINRNKILINKQPNYINLPLVGASQNKKINEITISSETRQKQKLLRSVEISYKKAPFFNDVYPLITNIISNNENILSLFLLNSFNVIAKYLELKTEFVLSSSIKKDNSLKGEDKILEMCRLLNSDEYYNAVGGMGLYNKNRFNKEGMNLLFLKMNEIKYKQFDNEFVPNLSIIDVLMFNSREETQRLLKEYELL